MALKNRRQNQAAAMQNKQISDTVAIRKSVIKNAITLSVFAFISTGLIAITYMLTKDKIALEIEQSLIRQLSEIVPAKNYTNNVFKDCIIINDRKISESSNLGSNEDQKAYRMRNNDSDYAVLMTAVAPDGYSGKIELAVVISLQNTILGINILNHLETPGLGDKIERKKSNWLNQFKLLSIESKDDKNWKVKKDGGQFDALTGATITPRAVIKAVYNSLKYFKENKKSLFNAKSNCMVE
jgi:electron transport complex protein RnfG